METIDRVEEFRYLRSLIIENDNKSIKEIKNHNETTVSIEETITEKRKIEH